MRTSKKPKTIEKFRIRRCVVRIQRMKIQNVKTRSAASKDPAPLKKRPVTGGIISTPASSMKAKDRMKTNQPIMQRTTKIVQLRKPSTTTTTTTATITPSSPTVEDLPPTIAAGRSRRAHKPNPKYASEDMVTSKILKSNKNDGSSVGKNRQSSLSSLDDFFNDDSSEAELEEEDEDSEVDRKFKLSKRMSSDSDFADSIDDSEDHTVVQPKRGPGRPRKTNKIGLAIRRPTTGSSTTSNILNKSAPATRILPTAKTTPNLKTPQTQLQQLRRTYGASTVSPLAMGRKRKIEEGEKESTPIATKRFIISSGAPKPIGSSNITTRRNSPNLSVNGSKTSTSTSITQSQKRETISNLIQDKKPLPTKNSLNLINTKTMTINKLQQQQQQQKTPPTTPSSIGGNVNARMGTPRVIPSNKQNNKSSNLVTSRTPTIAPKLKTVDSMKDRIKKKVDESPKEETPVDDFETMPTFTIVNINDIINKKGDVLISKTPMKKATPTVDRSKVLSMKRSPERLKSSMFRTSTPLVRKPPEKNLINDGTNNKYIGKNVSSTLCASNAGSAGGGAEKKPAPRILNSVVSRKTKPIKPMIANLDISTDSPSCSLSLYDDDEDEFKDDDSKIDGSSSNENESLELTKHIQSKLYSGGNFIKSKSSEPKAAAKENSLAATNVQSQSNQTAQSKILDSRKLSPEKVIVSRQGDKIIKKITCFETWYVINIPADSPEEYEKNSLNMPLIEIANAMKKIKLPTSSWTTKVTLFEVSASTLAKSRMITYTGDLVEQNIPEEERYRYQPSCVMFRRTVTDRSKCQLPYDRAVIFKNRTFFTNIEGKNVKLVGAPSTITQVNEIETLLHIVDSLTLQSSLVEPAATL